MATIIGIDKEEQAEYNAWCAYFMDAQPRPAVRTFPKAKLLASARATCVWLDRTTNKYQHTDWSAMAKSIAEEIQMDDKEHSPYREVMSEVCVCMLSFFLHELKGELGSSRYYNGAPSFP